MKSMQICSLIRKKNQRRIDLKNTKYKCENLLERNFKQPINKVLCTDVTYIPYREKNLYLSSIIDVGSNVIKAWKLSNKNDIKLVMDSFYSVEFFAKETIIHSDYGFQYSSTIFQ